MFRTLVKKIVQIIKGRSAHQIKKSDLDNLIDDFENQREQEPESRRLEREKFEKVAQNRDL